MIIRPNLSCIDWLEFVYRMNAIMTSILFYNFTRQHLDYIHDLIFVNIGNLIQVKTGNMVCHHRNCYSALSINLYFLPSPDRILPALMEKNKITNSPQWEFNSQPLGHHPNTLPNELSHYLVVCVNH